MIPRPSYAVVPRVAATFVVVGGALALAAGDWQRALLHTLTVVVLLEGYDAVRTRQRVRALEAQLAELNQTVQELIEN